MNAKRSERTELRTAANSPPTAPARTRRTGSIWGAGLLLVAMTVAVYLPATQCGYIWDDDQYVHENQVLRSTDGLRRIWFDIGATPQYYPTVYTTYWLEYRLWKLNPAGYHVVNILLHAVGAALVWRVLRVLQVPGAWLAAAVFALHPVHVESVAWITERKNVLSGVFYLGAAFVYLCYALTPKEGAGRVRSGRRYVAALILFLCALLSKTVTCTLPAALLLLIWWKRKRLGWADVRALAPFFVLGVALGLLTVWMEKHRVGAVGEAWNLSLVERCLIAGRVLCFYVGKLLWPTQLTFIYPRWHIDTGVWWQCLFPAAATVGVVVLWLARRRIGRGPLVAVLFFAGTLIPALGFFDVYPMRFSFVADHFQYMASVGIITLVVAAAASAGRRIGKWGMRAAPIVAVLVLAVLGTLSWRQEAAYADQETLWRDTLVKNPNAGIAHNNLGMILKNRGQLDEAISHFRQALQVTPIFPSDVVLWNNNLGNALSTLGKFEEALSHFKVALQVKPNDANSYYNVGLALGSRGKVDAAISHYRRALELDPNHPAANVNLGNALFAQGELEEAIACYRRALEAKPDLLQAHLNLGIALKNTGRLDEALEHFREAMRQRPDWPAALRNTAWILATHTDPNVRDGNEAIRLAERAAELTGYKNARVLDTLAAAYAETGQFDRAVTTAQAALASASANQANELANRIRMRLQLYGQARPYRQPVRAEGAIRP